MAAGRVNFVIEQGASFLRTLRWLNPKQKFLAQNSGTSGATAPDWKSTDTGDTIVDNDITWLNIGNLQEDDLTGSDAIDMWTANTAYEAMTTVFSTDEPVDLTGYSGRLQIREDVADEDGELYWEMTTDDGGIVITTPETEGEIMLIIQASDTESFEWEAGRYDLEMISPATTGFPDGFTTRLIFGRMSVSKEVTRDTQTVTVG